MVEKTTIELFKEVMIEMFRGYPDYVFFGLFEQKFGKQRAENITEILRLDGLIEHPLDFNTGNEDSSKWKLTRNGINFAISMIELDYNKETSEYSKEISNYSKKVLGYNKEVSKYSQETHYFTRLIIWLTWLLVIIGSMTIVVGLAQYFHPPF